MRAGPPPKTAFTKQGAEEFVRAYYATINAVLAARPGSADATELAKALLSYGSRDCECRYTQRFFVRHVADGDHFVGTGYRLQSVRINAMAGNSAVVLVSFSLGSVKTVSPAGRVMDVQQKVGAETDTFVVAYLSQSWKMTRQFVGKSH